MRLLLMRAGIYRLVRWWLEVRQRLMGRRAYRIACWWFPLVVAGALLYWALESAVHSSSYAP